MRRTLQWVPLCVLLGLLACGGGSGSVTINPTQLASAKTVALVGVCLPSQMAAVQGTESVALFGGDGAQVMLEPLVLSLNAALAAQWTGVKVVPFAVSPAAQGRAAGEERVCAGGQDPMLPEGYLGTPDTTFLAQLATTLGVDAVLVVSANPILRYYDGDGAKAYIASIGSGVELSMINAKGESVAFVELQNFETGYYKVAGTDNTADAIKIGAELGQLISKGFVAALQGKDFEPPSRPGMTGL